MRIEEGIEGKGQLEWRSAWNIVFLTCRYGWLDNMLLAFWEVGRQESRYAYRDSLDDLRDPVLCVEACMESESWQTGRVQVEGRYISRQPSGRESGPVGSTHPRVALLPPL